MEPSVLIIRLTALGDIIHALPVLAALRRAFPGGRIGWLCEPAGAALLQGHPMLDALHVVPRKAWREGKWSALRGPLRALVHDLRARRYDVTLDVQGLTKSAVWGWLARAPRRIGFRGSEARELAGLFATERVAPPPDALHVCRRNLALLAPLGIAAPEKIEFPIHLPAAARERAVRIVGGWEADAPLAILNPGAGWETKIWAPERYGQLARMLVDQFGARVGVAWGPGEEPLARDALTASGAGPAIDFELGALPDRAGIYPLPATSFVELGAVISHARLFVGGDTGPTHLAAALGVSTVSVMGPLDARRNGPCGTRCVAIQHGVPRRAPFWRKHHRWCDPRTDLRHVTVEEVFEACVRMLEGAAVGI